MDFSKLAEEMMQNMMTISSHPPQKKMEHFHGGEMLILLYLMKNGDTAPSEFAKVSRTSTAHVAKALRHLEAKGDIVRRPDPKDARKKLVSITTAGILRCKAQQEEVFINTQRMLQDLGEEDAKTLVRLTGKLAKLIADRNTSIE